MPQATASATTEVSGPSKPGQAKRTATKAIDDPSKTMYAVEKPVPTTQPKQHQFVVTVDGQSGAVTKIEKIDDKSGNKTELSKEEYAAMYGQWLALASPYYYNALMSAYGTPYY